MQISFGEGVMNPKVNLIFLAAIVLTSCSPGTEQSVTTPVVKADKPFAAAGSIEMQLDGGDYLIQASSDERIRVSFAGNIGNATADVGTTGTRANVVIKDTPHSNFRATVEVPATTDLTIRLSGGNLEVAAIKGNKDIDSKAGNVEITIPNANEYGTVDAAVKVGNLDGGPFGDSHSGLSPHLKWSGSGKYTLRASLGAGNLELNTKTSAAPLSTRQREDIEHSRATPVIGHSCVHFNFMAFCSAASAQTG